LANFVHYEVVVLSEGVEGYIIALLAQFYGLKTALICADIPTSNTDKQPNNQPTVLDAAAARVFSTLGLSSHLDKNNQHPNLRHFLSQKITEHKQIAYYHHINADKLRVDNHPEQVRLSYDGNKWNLSADFLLCGKDIPTFLQTQLFPSGGCKYTQYRPKIQLVDQINAGRIARHWRYERYFLLAGAAYRLPEWLAVGEQNANSNVQTNESAWTLSAALQDAQNLLWKLFLVNNQRASAHLLTAYQGERQPIVAQKIAHCLSHLEYKAAQSGSFLSKLFAKSPKDNLVEQERLGFGIIANAVDKLSNTAQRSRYIWGTYLPQYPLKGENGLLIQPDRVQMGGFMLIGWAKNPVDWLNVAEVDFLAGLRCSFLQIIPTQQPFSEQIRHTTSAQDVETQGDSNPHNWQQWFKQHQTNFVLVRPDRVIFGTADDMEQLEELLRQLRVKLTYQPVVFPELDDDEFYQWAEKAQVQL